MTERYAARTEHTATQEIDGEAVVINFDTYHYYGFNRSAAALWSLLQGGGRERGELAAALHRAFGATAMAAAADVDRLIAALLEEGLIETTDTAATEQPEIAGDGDYVAPQFDRHGKLDQLMLSGE